MSSTIMLERTSGQGVGFPGFSTPSTPAPTSTPFGSQWLMVPRCHFKVEKFNQGVRIQCFCDDKLASNMVQNLCSMMAGGMFNCCVYWNGMTVTHFNWTMGSCHFENTDQGVCFTFSSGDKQCCEMIQSFGQCLTNMFEAGCTCCFFFNQTPVCCGGFETNGSKSKTSK